MSRRRLPDVRGRDGLSLTLVLVLLAVLAGLGLVVNETNRRNLAALRSSELKGELKDVRATIRAGLSCAATLPTNAGDCPCVDKAPTPPSTQPGYSCGAGDWFALKRADLSDLVPRNALAPGTGSLIGAWSVRASCSPTQLVIEAARLDDTGKPQLDPASRRPLEWKPLFAAPLCKGGSSGLAATLRSCTPIRQGTTSTFMCTTPACAPDETLTGGGIDLGRAAFDGSRERPGPAKSPKTYTCVAWIDDCVPTSLARPCGAKCYGICTRRTGVDLAD